MLRITGVEVPRSVGLRGSEKIAPHVDILLDGMVAQNPLFLGLVIDGVGGAVLSSTSLSKPPGMRNPFSTVYALEARGGGGGGIFSDPRSPTERGTSTPVIRNIFDVL